GIVEGYTGRTGYAYFPWPGYCTVDLEKVHDLSSIRILLWDNQGQGQSHPDDRKYKYRLLASEDQAHWRLVYETDDVGTIGWQVFDFDKSLSARYIRVHGLWCSKQLSVHIVQLEAYDAPTPSLPSRSPMVHLRLGAPTELIEEVVSYKATSTMRDIIVKLRRIPDDYPVINGNPFRNVADELEMRLDDITQIEERIDAVHRRIVEPVAKELEFGRQANRLGLWTGLAGIIVSIVLFAISVYLN